MDATPFSNFIKSRRQELHLSLRAASKATGIQPSRLHDLEMGVSSTTYKATVPTRENIRRLAKGYGVSEDHLLALAGRPEIEPEAADEQRLLSHFRDLVPGHKAVVLSLVDQLYQLDRSS